MLLTTTGAVPHAESELKMHMLIENMPNTEEAGMQGIRLAKKGLEVKMTSILEILMISAITTAVVLYKEIKSKMRKLTENSPTTEEAGKPGIKCVKDGMEINMTIILLIPTVSAITMGVVQLGATGRRMLLLSEISTAIEEVGIPEIWIAKDLLCQRRL
jgi:hypothetical protein